MSETQEGTGEMAAATSDRELRPVEKALLAAIGEIPDPRPSTVIPAVVSTHRGEDVRGAYWRLLGRNVVSRGLDGRLSVVRHS